MSLKSSSAVVFKSRIQAIGKVRSQTKKFAPASSKPINPRNSKPTERKKSTQPVKPPQKKTSEREELDGDEEEDEDEFLDDSLTDEQLLERWASVPEFAQMLENAEKNIEKLQGDTEYNDIMGGILDRFDSSSDAKETDTGTGKGDVHSEKITTTHTKTMKPQPQPSNKLVINKELPQRKNNLLRANVQRVDRKVEESAPISTSSNKPSDGERLQKLIARAGIASRRDAEKMILDGRVRLNGELVDSLSTKARPHKDKIMVDGKPLRFRENDEFIWIMLNKPKDVLSVLVDDKGRTTITKFIPKANELRLVPVGRMDRMSTGLLLLTNDISYVHPLTHPSFPNYRRHLIVVQGMIPENVLVALNQGQTLPGTNIRFPPCAMDVIDYDSKASQSTLDVSISDSSATVIEEMMKATKTEIVGSKRIEFGPLRLGDLKKGEWRRLSAAEVNNLKASCATKLDRAKQKK